jgi:ribonuclease HI
MELTAVKEALLLLPHESNATIFSDSKEVLMYCEDSIPIWRKNGWKNLPYQFEVLLKEINCILDTKKLSVKWTWVKSHNGNIGNEKADLLAGHGAREAKKLIKKFD